MSHDVYDKRAKEVMSRDLVTIDSGDSIHEAIQLMAENKVAALPVVDRHGKCIGFLSSSDLVEVTRDIDAGLYELESTEQSLWGAYLDKVNDHIGHQRVMDLMSEAVIGIKPDALLFDAASLMLREHVHRLPVLDSNQHLLGIISMTDILEAFVECAPTAA